MGSRVRQTVTSLGAKEEEEKKRRKNVMRSTGAGSIETKDQDDAASLLHRCVSWCSHRMSRQ